MDVDLLDDALQHTIIPSPCSFGWDNMQGTEEKRFCSGCQTNVYNLSSVSSERANKLLNSKNVRCVRITRRKDGSVVNDACPRWLRPLKLLWRESARVAIAAIAMVLTAPFGFADSATQDVQKKETPEALFNVEGTPIDARHYTSGRDERHRKVSPLLPSATLANSSQNLQAITADKLLTKGRAYEILGKDVELVPDSEVREKGVTSVLYSDSQPAPSFVMVTLSCSATAQLAQAAFATEKQTLHGVTVDGIGEECFRTSGAFGDPFAALLVLKGNKYVYIAVNRNGKIDNATEDLLAREFLEKM